MARPGPALAAILVLMISVSSLQPALAGTVRFRREYEAKHGAHSLDTPLQDQCEPLTTAESCDSTEGCVWCKSAAIPSSCFTKEQAQRLPPGVFVCDS
mmetsp:Transcript_28743/g.80926  ORF Transcript_28743/g.80926 Transcript_28743/m.80926 type:complete len:98 (-) Transcript_28743:301-594(-)|eukprot:CAMPEP_0117677260 /NCGR_PEP_ID=MMETSP0804-20121206/16650_1 /TAXON_ID=1074897 /ORGANISM="Tetraselmis astigmatica, Strain CCMP880" /LENGTH=97 /DNA_ID=CAMNT_0005486531 /DNA_START=230 /DNA_END=523 /DNA_ORIENTATION=+